jgi:hypothetical protein
MRFALLLAPMLALAACGGGSDDAANPEESGRKGSDAPASFGPDFTELKLGPKVEGSEFESRLIGFGGTQAGELNGYVACADGLESCADAGENAVYTYVLELTPRDASSAFRTAERAYGFTGVAGYDKAAVRAALPGDSRLTMLCSDGVLVWAIEGGEGWSRKPVTLYWQSTSLPVEDGPGYVLVSDGKRSAAKAPSPTEGSTDKCG